jgi:hypothetical protein
MSDLRPIGEVLVDVQAHSLTAGADELRDRHHALQGDYKRHRDPEKLALQMAWLALVAIARIRQMEESHAGSDPDRARGRRPARRRHHDAARRPDPTRPAVQPETLA